MKNVQNIESKINEDLKKNYQHSELLKISNKENDLNQSNIHNETLNKIILSMPNENEIENEKEFKLRNSLYGNNYFNYYVNNKFSLSKNCLHSKVNKMGNLNVFFFVNEQPLIAIGNKNTNLIIIYELILQISFHLLIYFIGKSIPIYMKYLLILNYLICFFCHIYIFLVNPGIPSIDHYRKIFLKSENYMKMGESEKKHYYLCEICNIIINFNEDIEHCEECQICIEKFDHHCFWTGKCITSKNILAFYFFSFGTMIYILFYFTIIIYWLCTLGSKKK